MKWVDGRIGTVYYVDEDGKIVAAVTRNILTGHVNAFCNHEHLGQYITEEDAKRAAEKASAERAP